MIRGIHHAAISTGDLQRALAFYRDLLGFEMVFEGGWPAGVEVADNITGLPGLFGPAGDASRRKRLHRAVPVRVARSQPG